MMEAKIEDGYTHYVRLEPGYTIEKPLGLFRAVGGDILEIEALRHDGEWHYSGELMVNVLKKEFDIEEISKETAEIALKNLL